jgi:hypothetical protein
MKQTDIDNDPDIGSIIYYNGNIITLEDSYPDPEAVGIMGERIFMVGDFVSIKNRMGKNAKLINLEGKTLLPGFIDSHLHPIMYLFFLINPDLSKCTSLAELQDLLKEASKDKNSDELLLGLRLMEENFDKPKLPTRWDLDKACPNIPVFLLRYDGHIGILNTKGLELIGIDNATKPPEGGEIRKDENGEITGVLSEQAIGMALSMYSLPSPKEFNKAAEEAFQNFAKKGLTTLHGIIHADKGGEFGSVGSIELPIYRAVQDIILQNWYAMVFTERPKKLRRYKKPPLHYEELEAKFKLNCLKLFIDGTFGAATAYMFQPFSDQPDKTGFCVVDLNDLYEQMKTAHNLGFQIGVHAIGDKGNRLLVDLYKRLLKENPREDHRHRIEHASLLKDDVIKDIKELGILVSSQPPFMISEQSWLEKRIGKERIKYAYPYKTLLDNGIIIAAGSDCPVEDPDVIEGINAMVNRHGINPKEAISVKEALKAYTINGAYAGFEEDIKGTIKPGKLADLVILDKNPLKIQKSTLKNLKIEETIIRGQSVYRKP